MRKVNIGSSNFTEVLCLDEPGQGGACHEYIVAFAKGVDVPGDESPPAEVRFQNGPIKEFGVNGCHHEDLLAIVIDRLRSFQSGEFACRENALALTKLEEATHWLNRRTTERKNQGVEGTNQHRVK